MHSPGTHWMVNTVDLVRAYVNTVVTSKPMKPFKMEEICRATQNDAALQKWLCSSEKGGQRGWWVFNTAGILHSHGSPLWIRWPRSLPWPQSYSHVTQVQRPKTAPHQGLTKRRERDRLTVWWPNNGPPDCSGGPTLGPTSPVKWIHVTSARSTNPHRDENHWQTQTRLWDGESHLS